MQGRYRDGIPEDEKKRILGCAFSGAILIAPFVALLYSKTIALVVLIFALGSAAWFAFEGSRGADAVTQARLRVLAGVNVVLLVLAVAALLWIEFG
ncbi:MAG: hypothetical protein KF883_09080 [Thermomicrobiales bacterium]|nr:hypothetical protein [Thermomicrobiales bacterium]